MAETKLVEFVEKSLQAGASREEIEQILNQAGWPADEVNDALSAFSSVEFAVPVPRPKLQLSAREAFMYLLMFGMLYLSVYHLIQLIIQLIDYRFPDALNERSVEYTFGKVRWSISSLVVTFPVFLFMSSRVAKHIDENPVNRTSGIRKWLTYLTLTLAACVIVGDLIYLINNLLSGELTIRFVLKALTVGVISGAVFWYYLWLMHADDAELAK